MTMWDLVATEMLPVSSVQASGPRNHLIFAQHTRLTPEAFLAVRYVHRVVKGRF